MFGTIIKIIKYGMEINWQELDNENPKVTIHSSGYDRSETTGEYGVFQLFG
jgi:hypothetical protein